LKPELEIFYHPEQNSNPDSDSPSAAKPAKVMDAWLKEWPALEVASFDPIRKEDLYEVHQRSYVDAVLDLSEPNGFGTYDDDVNASLLYTCGSILRATQHVMDHGGVAVSPTSGFHHAGYAKGGGYCTFNGLALAAVTAAQAGHRVAIIDCDYHYGDGTAGILRTLDPEALDIKHESLGAKFHGPEQGEAYLARLHALWAQGYFDDVDLILYQAGADVHVDDPLGGVLTTEQMQERDRTMFQGAYRNGIPMVWNLAGGYLLDSEGSPAPVVALHSNTMRACLQSIARQVPQGAGIFSM
jgi:acetoin utilization deacetylase AcuC-like enzyme